MHLHPGFVTFPRSNRRNSTFLHLRGGVPDSGGTLSESAWETGERNIRGRSILLARAVVWNVSNWCDWARIQGHAEWAECVLRWTKNRLSHLGRGGWGGGCQEIGFVTIMFFFELLFPYAFSQFPSMFPLLTYSQSFFSLSADYPRHSRWRKSKIRFN